MYSLDINFLKDRPEYAPAKTDGTNKPKAAPTSRAPIILGAVVGLGLLGGAFGAKLFLDSKNTEIAAEIAAIDAALAQQQAQRASIQQINQETEAIKAETQALATVFNQIKPWSALLEEIRDLAPPSVQIENIQKAEIQLTPDPAAPPPAAGAPPAPTSKPGVEISGTARTFNDVNDFMLLLQNSEFFSGQEVRLVSSNLQQNNTQVEVPGSSNVQVQLPPVVKFQIKSALNDKPASEILAELRRQGAEGLVERIQYLQEKGVIQ